MNVGDYVRNKYGIAKVIDKENNNGIDILVFDKPICFLVNKKTGEIKDDRLLNRLAIIDGVDVNKIKSSPNIIDLIEVGDIITTNNLCGEITKIEGNKTYTTCYDGEYCSASDIKSIVTKEQFKSMEYKVGE